MLVGAGDELADLGEEGVDFAAEEQEVFAGELDADDIGDERRDRVVFARWAEDVCGPSQEQRRYTKAGGGEFDVTDLVVVRFGICALGCSRACAELAGACEPFPKAGLVRSARAPTRDRVHFACELRSDALGVDARRERLDHDRRGHVVGVTVAVQDRDRTASETAHDDGPHQSGGRDDRFDVFAPTRRRERVPIEPEYRTGRCPVGRTRRPDPVASPLMSRTPIGSSNSASIDAVPDKSKTTSWVVQSASR